MSSNAFLLKQMKIDASFPELGVPCWGSLQQGLRCIGVYSGVPPFRETTTCDFVTLRARLPSVRPPFRGRP